MKNIKFRFFPILISIILALWVFGPYEESDLSANFDSAKLDDGVDAYFSQTESRFDDITPGVHKQVIWAGPAEAKTEWSVLYIHGFSATAQEIRPVPDEVAKGLNANLIYTRLTGHGRGGDALAQTSVSAWMHDVAEGLAVARKIGDRVLIISTSTGSTLAAAAAVQPELMENIAGIVMISPNFGIKNAAAPLLTLPAARYWLPLIAGRQRSFTPQNQEHGIYWTTQYPSVAVMPMAALIKAVDAFDLAQAKVPALFWFSPEDKVVDANETLKVTTEWGGPVKVVNPELGPEDDAFAHVIAGDILSPSQNTPTINGILDWAKGL